MEASASLERIREYVDRHRPALATPGLAIGVTDRRRFLGAVVDGFANVDAGEPVGPRHRFQIGSISKGFTALAVLRQMDEGRLDVDEPVTTYLPWFEVRSAFAPITLHHLLSHTGGIVMGSDFTGDAASEVWLLRETETGGPPGERFRYSNAGFKALGLVLESVTGEPWWETVRARVMRPMGMGEADVVITDDARPRLAIGYGSTRSDRPWLPRHGFAPTPWFESGTADGTICATAEELTAYARLLLGGGAGVVSPGAFERMTRPVAEDPESGEAYGYGVKWSPDGGRRRLLGHTGGMIGFSSHLMVDVDAGVGAVVLMNSVQGNRLELIRFVLDCLAAEASGDPLPGVPDPSPPRRVEDAGAYAGRYADADGEVELAARGDELHLRAGGPSASLVPADGSDVFLVDDPALDRFPMRFLREAGVVTSAFWGPRWLRQARHAGPVAVDHPEAWAACAGRYASWNPWAPGFRVFLRRGQLWLAPVGDRAEPEQVLAPLADGSFRVGETSSPDRVRFDAIVGGAAQRAVLDAAPYYRAFTT